MKFNNIKTIFEKDLINVDNFIINNLKSEIPLISDIGKYIIFYSGKKIRPLITILFSKLFNYKCDNKLFSISSAIELIHTATLLHDDVIDHSEKRRGKLSVNKMWGNKEAILVGDFLYTRSFQLMVSIDNIKILELMSKVTNLMSEGEVSQLLNKNNFNISENDYFNVIKLKTAELFSAASSVIPILMSKDKEIIYNSYLFGYHFGILYQLIDDILDYTSNSISFGKNLGDDISNGTFTLPLILYISKNKKNKDFVLNLFNNKNFSNDNIYSLRDKIIESSVLDYVLNLAKHHANISKKAILSINESDYYSKIALNLVDIVLNKKF